MTLTAKEAAYLDAMAAQIVSTLGQAASDILQANPIGVLTAAHEQRQMFGWEIIHGKTDRARMARIALEAEVYIALVTIGARQRDVERCEHIADQTYRKSISLG